MCVCDDEPDAAPPRLRVVVVVGRRVQLQDAQAALGQERGAEPGEGQATEGAIRVQAGKNREGKTYN